MKGPNDRLSTKQHVWLDVLVSLGVDAEVLYVKGTSFVSFKILACSYGPALRLIGPISYLGECYIQTKVTKCIREKMTLYTFMAKPLNHIHQGTKSARLVTVLYLYLHAVKPWTLHILCYFQLLEEESFKYTKEGTNEWSAKGMCVLCYVWKTTHGHSG